MQSAADLTGLAVITATTGERLGRVHDVIFDAATGQITGFMVDPGGLFTKAQLLARGLVRSLGADACIVEGGTTLEPVHADPPIPGSLAVRSLAGRPVLDQTGKHIGNVAGAVVDEPSLSVPALQITTGMLDKMLRGKHDLPLSLVQAIGPDSVIAVSAYDPQASGGAAGPEAGAEQPPAA
jgi:uncharacterized protein YrrD